MAITIQKRRGTAAEWASENPTLAEGEEGYVTDTARSKVGNGTDAWNDLAYPQTNPVVGVATYEDSAEPAAPESGKLHIYTRKLAGRMLPRFKGPSGLDSALQPAIFGNGMYIVSPGTTTAMNVLGGPAVTNVGTLSHPNLNSSSLRQSTSRAQVVSAATANSVAETRAAFARSWRGDQAGFGGFFFRMRFGIISTVAGQRSFFGLTNSTAAIATTQDPVGLLQCCGIGNANADDNLQMLANDGAGACTKVDLGSNFPAQGVDDLYELTMFAAPNSTEINWRIERLVAAAMVEGTFSGADIPSSSAFLAPHAYMNNNGVAAAVQFDLVRLYIESDY